MARHEWYPHERWLTGVTILEPMVIVLEAWIYWIFLPISRKKAGYTSLIANLLSLLPGVLPHLI
ncbi:MAG: hypothetical protein ACXWRZ_15165 [Bdellovibrio sp.]